MAVDLKPLRFCHLTFNLSDSHPEIIDMHRTVCDRLQGYNKKINAGINVNPC